MANTVLEELVTILGFEIDDEEAEEYAERLDGIKTGLTRILQVSAGAAAALTAFITVNERANDELVKFARTIDMTVGEVQRLIHAGRLMGAADGDVMSSLANLNRLASEAHRGIGAGVEIFGLLGLSAEDGLGRIKPVGDLLGEIADKIMALDSAAEQAEFAQKLGISDRMVLLLKQGRNEIGELGAELDAVGAILTPEQQRIAEDFTNALTRGRAVIRGWANDISSALAPAMTETINKFYEWAAANRELIESEISEWMQAFENSLPSIMVALGVIAAVLAVMFAPVALAVAKFGAILFLVTELIDTFRGLDTITRRAFDMMVQQAQWAFGLINEWLGGLPKKIAMSFIPDSGAIPGDWERLKGFVTDSFGGFGPMPAAVGAGGGGVTTTINQSGTVVIHGNADEEAVKRAQKRALEESAREAESDLSNPVVG
jgi:hypothetical protein